jgi:FKBP-type peptidyl-prolyl cis-trans isomerase
MKDSDASNLTFTLVDSNYFPVKLMSPMYVVLRLEPTENPAESINEFKGKLPKDVGTTIKPMFYEQPKINLNVSDHTFSVNREWEPTPETQQKVEEEQQQQIQAQQQQVQAQAQQQAQEQATERQEVEDANQKMELAKNVAQTNLLTRLVEGLRLAPAVAEK